MSKEELWRYLKTQTKKQPELTNVADGHALWKIPFCDDHVGISKAISVVMDELEGRWSCQALGVHENAGEIYEVGLLSGDELEDIMQGRFPKSLELYGVPGPGVCVGPVKDESLSQKFDRMTRWVR